MFIEKAILHNIGKHKHLEVDFKRGLVGIIGANGAGKSTLVDFIYAMLTNDWSRFNGVKADVINDTMEAGDQSYGELFASHAGVPFSIRRGLKPSKNELKVGKEPVISKAGEIEERLRKDLGVDMKLISGYVFVAQGKMFDILDMTPAVRAEAFKHLCRTQKADVIYDACSKLLESMSVDTELVDNSDQLVGRIGIADTMIAEVHEAEAVQEKLLLNPKSYESARQIIQTQKNYDALKHDIEAAEEQIREIEKKYNLEKKAATQAELQAAASLAVAKTLKEPAKAADAALKEWKAFARRAQRAAVLETLLSELEEEKADHTVPEKPDDYDSRSRYSTFVLSAERDISEATAVIDTFEVNQSGKCPTCLQEIDNTFVDKMRKRKAMALNVFKDLRPKLKAIEKYDADKGSYDRWLAGWKARKAGAEEELASMDELEEPKGDKAQLAKTIDEFEQAERVAEEDKEAAEEAVSKYNKTSARYEERKEQHANLRNRLDQLRVNPAKYQKAKERLAEHEAAALEMATLTGRLGELERTKAEAEEELANLKAVFKRQKKLKRALATLSAARDVFHWSRLPQRVAQGNLLSMEEAVNGALSWFGDPFWVEAATEEGSLGFNVHQAGHPPCPAERLSWGQKGVFAVAFRYSVSSLFDADIGMMFLDEPTAWMDEENVGYFAEALQRLAAEVRGKRQLVVITHHEKLLTAFDQVIQV